MLLFLVHLHIPTRLTARDNPVTLLPQTSEPVSITGGVCRDKGCCWSQLCRGDQTPAEVHCGDTQTVRDKSGILHIPHTTYMHQISFILCTTVQQLRFSPPLKDPSSHNCTLKAQLSPCSLFCHSYPSVQKNLCCLHLASEVNVPPAHTHYFNPHMAVDRPGHSDSVWCSLALFLCVTISSSTRQWDGFILYSFAVFFFFFLLWIKFCTKATWALCEIGWWKHLVALGVLYWLLGIVLVCSHVAEVKREFCIMLRGNHNNHFIIIASVF